MTTDRAVAVVIPVRNGAAYVAEAIGSARLQVPAPAELVVVDDASDDDSAACATAAGAVVLAQPARGAGSARNAGVRRCRSPLVAFLDADDRMTTGRLARQLSALAEDPGLDGVLGAVRTFDDRSGSTIGPVEPGWLPSTLLVRRAAFAASGGFAEDLAAGEFIDWMARCRDQGRRFAMLDSVVAERRAHTGNLTRDADRLRSGYLEVARRAVDRQRADGPGR